MGGPGCVRFFAELEPALLEWYATGVKPGLIGAIGLPLVQVIDAIREYFDWHAAVQLLGVGGLRPR